MKRKFMWLFLSGVMLLAAGGCGKDPQTVDAGEPVISSETSETGTQTDTAAETTETSKTASAAGSSSSTTHTAAETVSAEQSRTATTASAAASSATAATTTAKAGTTTAKAASSAAPQTSAQTAASTTPKATTTTTTPQSSSSYTLNDIKTNINAYYFFEDKFRDELMDAEGKMLVGINMPYGVTSGYCESTLALLILNENYINDSVVSSIFSIIPQNELDNCKEFFYKISLVQMAFNTNVDYTHYTIDYELGAYLNQIQQAYNNGTFDAFMTDQFVNGNMPSKYKTNTAVLSLMHSYDFYSTYITEDYVDSTCMDNLLDRICRVTYGSSYIN